MYICLCDEYRQEGLIFSDLNDDLNDLEEEEVIDSDAENDSDNNENNNEKSEKMQGNRRRSSVIEVGKEKKKFQRKQLPLPPRNYKAFARILNTNTQLNITNQIQTGVTHVKGELGNLNISDLRENTKFCRFFCDFCVILCDFCGLFLSMPA